MAILFFQNINKGNAEITLPRIRSKCISVYALLEGGCDTGRITTITTELLTQSVNKPELELRCCCFSAADCCSTVWFTAID